MSGRGLENRSLGVLHVHLQEEEHDSPVTEHILTSGRLHITLRARVRKEFDFAQSEGMREKSNLRGRMKISRVKQQQQQQQQQQKKMFEKFYSAGREGSITTCIFHWLWLTETEVRHCMSLVVLLSILAENTDNGRSGVLPGSTTLTCRHIVP
jgi:type II secretory pathway component PulJ